jgi:hypothetical protein
MGGIEAMLLGVVGVNRQREQRGGARQEKGAAVDFHGGFCAARSIGARAVFCNNFRHMR